MNPCGKQRVVAVLVAPDGRMWIGENLRRSRRKCPRKELPTGTGCHHCLECGQKYHAEIDALEKADGEAKGGTMYLFGHNYACADCQRAMDRENITARFPHGG